MGSYQAMRNARVDAWLADGGVVLAANERATRSATAAFDAGRRAEGRTAWLTPAIFAWDTWVRDSWQERNEDGLVLLNPLQEQALWMRVIARSPAGAGLLHHGRLAAAAQSAHRLLCGYASNALKSSSRAGWAGDSAIFSEWLDSFEMRCHREGLVSNSVIGMQLAQNLLNEEPASDPEGNRRAPLLLIGFDRLLETQRALLDAWGEWTLEEPLEPANSTKFLAAPDDASEVGECVDWLRSKLHANPQARLIVVTTGLQENRGRLERALMDSRVEDGSRLNFELDFEFSLGVPLARVGLARSAVLLLRWLSEPISESELDWLLGNGHCAASAEEEIALSETMHQIRRNGHERPSWELDDFAGMEGPNEGEGPFADWTARLRAARGYIRTRPARQGPLEWVAVTEQLLDAVGWPGFRPLSSVAFQARKRWERVLEDCGSLGFDGVEMEWAEFVATLGEAASSSIFATESTDARVQITEPLESAGQLADGIWFLGANEEAWPGRGQPHPLLPIGLQRESGMPHASPQADWTLCQEATGRLIASADEVVFSYARVSAGTEARPSRLVTQRVGSAQRLIVERDATSLAGDRTETFRDLSMVPFSQTELRGGAAALTRQSLCPFQAFAVTRLNAEDWEPATTGLNPRQRGQLLHAVLHKVWGGSARGGISNLAELQSKNHQDLNAFVRRIVDVVMVEIFDLNRRTALPDRFPKRHLQLEKERLTELVSEWLRYELERQPFGVFRTEDKAEITIAGLRMKLRLDRIDEVPGGGKLVIDYKTGEVSPKAWLGERPDDVQLPLYATYAVQDDLEGLVFARVQPGKNEFCGRVRDAAVTLRNDLSKTAGLVKDPLTEAQLGEWRARIERLGTDFVRGVAAVDPKEPGKTCKSCHLHAVCRIYENQRMAVDAADEDSEQGEDELETGSGDA